MDYKLTQDFIIYILLVLILIYTWGIRFVWYLVSCFWLSSRNTRSMRIFLGFLYLKVLYQKLSFFDFFDVHSQCLLFNIFYIAQTTSNLGIILICHSIMNWSFFKKKDYTVFPSFIVFQALCLNAHLCVEGRLQGAFFQLLCYFYYHFMSIINEISDNDK